MWPGWGWWFEIGGDLLYEDYVYPLHVFRGIRSEFDVEAAEQVREEHP